jgi:MFS family permease
MRPNEIAERRVSVVRAVAAATIGNALEFYDFVTYGLFAIQIGHAFFPSKSAYVSLMLSLATFGAGFITRPIGGILIGAYSDRVGRRPAMMLSFSLMGAAILVLALIPPYAVIGIAAPILAVIARMVQGFSLGGEVGPTTAFLLEAVPERQRGFAVSWQGASQAIAIAIGGCVGFGLSNLMSPAALDAYGWRIAFLLGTIALPFGWWIRRTLPETLDAVDSLEEGTLANQSVLAYARGSLRILVLAAVVLAADTIGSHVGTYTATYAQRTLHLAPRVAFLAIIIPSVAGAVAVVFGGWLSDKTGRRPLIIWPALANLLLLFPIYAWITQSRSGVALTVGMGVLGVLGALSAGPFYTAVAETLPRRIRGGSFAIVYALSIAIFGGTTQMFITWLIKATGSSLAPAWLLAATGAVGFVARALILESAPAKARKL